MNMLDTRVEQSPNIKRGPGQSKRQFRVLIASRSQEAIESLQASMPDNPEFVLTTRLICNGHSDPLYGLEVTPDLLIFRLGPAWEAELEAIGQRPPAQRPPMLVVSSEPVPEVMRRAMHAGARDFFIEPVAAEELNGSVQLLFEECREQRQAGKARITAVINAKGGSGASLIASNLAHLLTARQHRRVALVDMDLQFGSLAHYLDLNPQRGVKEALDNIAELDKVALDGYLVTHASGVRVMGAESERLLLSDEVSHERLSSLLELMAESHDHLIIDLPRQIDLATTTVLERADQIVLVLQQGITHVRDAARLLDVLRQELEIDDGRIKVVLNRYRKDGAIKLAEVARALNHEPILTVPNDFRHVTDCLNNGMPLFAAAPRAAVTRSLTELAGQLERRREMGPARGLFGRMLSLFRRA